MWLATLTAVHVALSLVGIAAGLVVAAGMLRARRLPGWTALFLVSTVFTSLTGFLFSAAYVLPSHVVGAVSLVALAITLAARYVGRLAGSWRWVYAAGAVLALYLNVLVAVIQAFRRVPALVRLAPTQSEPPFVGAQLIVLLAFVVLGIRAVARFHPGTAARA
jgi:hypothetical protein